MRRIGDIGQPLLQFLVDFPEPPFLFKMIGRRDEDSGKQREP
jgi:hypothetical protein